jgi:hypothetical protein
MSAADAGATASGEAGGALVAGRMTGVADVTPAVAGFIALEVLERRCSAGGQRAMVAMTRIEAVVDVSIESAWSVEPGTGADEDSAEEPVRTVVAVGRAVVGREVEVAVGAVRLGPYVDADGDLAAGGKTAQKRNGKSCEDERFPAVHGVPPKYLAKHIAPSLTVP